MIKLISLLTEITIQNMTDQIIDLEGKIENSREYSNPDENINIILDKYDWWEQNESFDNWVNSLSSKLQGQLYKDLKNYEKYLKDKYK